MKLAGRFAFGMLLVGLIHSTLGAGLVSPHDTPATVSQANAILKELQVVETLLARRDVAAGILPAVEGALPAARNGDSWQQPLPITRMETRNSSTRLGFAAPAAARLEATALRQARKPDATPWRQASLPDVEGGILPPEISGEIREPLEFSPARQTPRAVSSAGLEATALRQARKPDATTHSTPALLAVPLIAVGDVAPCSGQIVQPMTLSMVSLPGGMVRVNGQGTPDTYHAIQARDDLLLGRWAEIATVLADGSGQFTLDLTPGATPDTRYFRALVDACPPCDETVAKALVYVNGYYDWATLTTKAPEQVCLTDLGIYDDAGNLIASHYGTHPWAGGTQTGFKLTGRYLTAKTESQYINFKLPDFVPAQNDFRIDANGDGSVPPERAVMWAAEANAYYWITDYRKRIFSPEFIAALNLPPDIQTNLLHRQYRLGGLTGGNGSETFNPAKPVVFPYEDTSFSPFGGEIQYLANKVFLGVRERRFGGTNLPVVANPFDPTITVGEYAALPMNWIHGSTNAFPQDPTCLSRFRNVGNPIGGCISDGVNAWAGYRYGGNPEVYKNYSYGLRIWGNRNCGTPTTPPCERGRNIDNVMMYADEVTTGDQVFPFDIAYPNHLSPYDGPGGDDVTGQFFPAVFYDLSKEVGLGDERADLLFWKTLSLITNPAALNMRQYGDLIIQAARQLWPGGANGTSRYERPIASALTSRGIPLYGAASILTVTYPNSATTILPTPIGDASSLTTYNASARFGSLHPDSQSAMSPGFYSYGAIRFLRNQYTSPGADFQYMTYDLYKHSKHGPCDKLMFTDGTFAGTSDPEPGEWNQDGTYFAELTGRRQGNVTIFIPGAVVRYNHFRARCATESQGAYFEDQSPFGFKTIQGMKNGFSFTAQRTGETTNTVTYELTVMDPSVTLTGPRTGAATYDWNVSDFNGQVFTAGGSTVSVTLQRNEPCTIAITRTRESYVDTLTKVERANDLDRLGGRAFIVDCLNPDPVTKLCQ